MRLLACLNPSTGWRLRGVNPSTGKKYGLVSADFARQYPPFMLEEVAFRCGKCINCLKYRGSVLMARCIAESRLHVDNAFITLTVSDENLEQVFPGSSLDHRPWQLFAKRLRKRVGGSSIKFLMCGEYGENTLRPHYHAVVFGVPAFVYEDSGVRRADGLKACRIRRDNPVFADCWPFGDVYCGRVEPASVAYVSGYSLKQYVLGRDDRWYKEHGLAPEYVKWSRRPGLGRDYFDKFDLVDECVDAPWSCGVPLDDGRRLFPGRYYLDWLRLTSPEYYDRLLSSYDSGNREGITTADSFSRLLAERDRSVDYLRNRVVCARRI